MNKSSSSASGFERARHPLQLKFHAAHLIRVCHLDSRCRQAGAGGAAGHARNDVDDAKAATFDGDMLVDFNETQLLKQTRACIARRYDAGHPGAASKAEGPRKDVATSSRRQLRIHRPPHHVVVENDDGEIPSVAASIAKAHIEVVIASDDLLGDSDDKDLSRR